MVGEFGQSAFPSFAVVHTLLHVIGDGVPELLPSRICHHRCMDKVLTSQEHEIIQQLILDRWNPHRISQKISNHFGLSVNQVRHIRRKPQFQAEYTKQLAIYKDSFDDVQLADRKERVKALDGLYQRIPDVRVALKIKVLQAIREEVGDDRAVLEVQHSGTVGIEIPPRASSYEEWIAQNRLMEQNMRAVEAEVVVER